MKKMKFFGGLALVLIMAMSLVGFKYNYQDMNAITDEEVSLALVKIGGEHGKYGYIDKTGTFVINPQFDGADDFSEGFAAVRIGDYRTGKWGYIDKTGKMVIEPQFDGVGFFPRRVGRSEGRRQIWIH